MQMQTKTHNFSTLLLLTLIIIRHGTEACTILHLIVSIALHLNKKLVNRMPAPTSVGGIANSWG